MSDVFARGGECGSMMDTLDWSATPIGAPESWPQSLRTAVGIVLLSRHPLIVWWGSELVMLYNDAVAPSFGSNHPSAIGSAGRDMFPQMWPVIGPMLEGVLRTGVATWRDDEPLPMDRQGFVETTYWTYSYSPVYVESGAVGGVFTATTETTDRLLAERRLRVLQQLTDGTAAARNAQQACALACSQLSHAADDVAFALIYLDDDDGLSLASASGLIPGGPGAPERASAGDENVEWPVIDVARSGAARVVGRGELPRLGDVSPEPVHCAMVLPIPSIGRDAPPGVLVIGCGTGAAFNDAYRQFFEQVAAAVSRSISVASTYEIDRQRAEASAQLASMRAALLDQERAARMDVERRALRAETQLERVIEAAGDGIWVLDADGSTVLVNPAAERMTGWSSAELIGRSSHPIIHHSRADGTPYPIEECPIYQSVADGTPCSVDSEVFWRKDGSSFPVVYTSHPIYDDDNTRIGAVQVFRDVTDQKLAEDRRGQFFAMASHELRTPLTAIAGFADTLTHRWGTLPDDQRLGFVRIINEQSERLSRLINDVLTLSRLERGGLATEPSCVEVCTFIQRVVEALGGGDIEITCEPGLQALTDPDHFEQILFNFVANAQKYGAAPIQIVAGSTDDGAVIEVRDHGVGVKADFRSQLFERFTQEHKRPEGAGTGLGLSIVDGLAHAQGGTAWFEPNLPTGSRFFVRLPAPSESAAN